MKILKMILVRMTKKRSKSRDGRDLKNLKIDFGLGVDLFGRYRPIFTKKSEPFELYLK